MEEISGKFGVVASTAYEKVNTTSTDENLFRLVPVLGHGARLLPLELVPKFVFGNHQKAMLRLVPLVRAPFPGTKSERGLKCIPCKLSNEYLIQQIVHCHLYFNFYFHSFDFVIRIILPREISFIGTLQLVMSLLAMIIESRCQTLG